MHLSAADGAKIDPVAFSPVDPLTVLRRRPAGRALLGLSWLNLLVAQMQTAFGAFLAVYLTTHAWSHTDIGLALSIGSIATIVLQIPAGALVDAIPSKRIAAGGAILAISACALAIGLWPGLWAVLAAEALHGGASCVLTPAIAALTLSLTRPAALGERFGRNMQFAAIGSGVAAAAMGVIGFYFSHRAIFFLGAGCGLAALVVLRAIRSETRDLPTQSPATARAPLPLRALLDRPLLVFAACMALFQLGNAAVLPIAANAVALTHGRTADLVVAAAIFLPQLLAAGLSPRFGRLAETWGRRPVLLLGLAALPLRALLYACSDDPTLVVLYSLLDGLSAAVLGLMVPLVVADLTRGTGRFNLAMGMVGLAVGLGATFSTLLAGIMADQLGQAAAFLGLAVTGLAAVAIAWRFMPETAALAGTPPA